MNELIRGLYAIADTHLLPHQDLGNAVALALLGGASLIQYRDKGQEVKRRYQEAKSLQQICRQHHVPLIINDDTLLAAEIGADGVHLGRDDLALSSARQILGADAIIGVSCYNELARAIAAEQAGADYVAFGRFFPSETKPEAIQASLELLREARKRLKLPIVAIGGITTENASQVIEAGANAVAIIGGLFKSQDIRATAAAYQQRFLSQHLPAPHSF
ncbi:thiamine phosphate synthase [Nitrosococcus wardiae]|uniref:Thiamine-phosphate synthase n=1 Tax=Nitrosococcus wardiae TaxID=1814290 RepID=A0A4P7BYW7_9GAMM|nr:thiamine phosphate synthase [Nitrosococcus wardiae]QBQ53626.1 thiamine phosphate synthase [Nitrosococcus wardiae]